MARPDERERDEDGAADALPDTAAGGPGHGRPKLTRRDAWHLVWATYKASAPYLLIFVIAMLAATWLVTTVLFR